LRSADPQGGSLSDPPSARAPELADQVAITGLMDTINLYILLGAPQRGTIALAHHEELEPDAFAQLCSEYEPAELEDAVVVAFERLERILILRDRGRPLRDGEDGEAPSSEEQDALHVLLGCLAFHTRESIEAGNRWAVIDVRYGDAEVCITVACAAAERELESPPSVGRE
jgi:hypothetical protein